MLGEKYTSAKFRIIIHRGSGFEHLKVVQGIRDSSLSPLLFHFFRSSSNKLFLARKMMMRTSKALAQNYCVFPFSWIIQTERRKDIVFQRDNRQVSLWFCPASDLLKLGRERSGYYVEQRFSHLNFSHFQVKDLRFTEVEVTEPARKKFRLV